MKLKELIPQLLKLDPETELLTIIYNDFEVEQVLTSKIVIGNYSFQNREFLSLSLKEINNYNGGFYWKNPNDWKPAIKFE